MTTPDSVHPDHAWAASLERLLDQAWKRLGRGVADRRAPARHPTLATVDRAGLPQARTVVLRSAEREPGILRLYTDRHANKVDELRANPHAALHVWDKIAHLQMRALCSAVVHTGASLEPVWAQLSTHARRCYGF